MLIILSQLLEAMVAQAREDHPLETCGVIAGPQGSDVAQKFSTHPASTIAAQQKYAVRAQVSLIALWPAPSNAYADPAVSGVAGFAESTANTASQNTAHLVFQLEMFALCRLQRSSGVAFECVL